MTPQIFELGTDQATIYLVALTRTATPHGAFPTREEAEAFLATLE
jgi:hypothetical protein